MSALPRSHARRAAVQALYHGLVNNQSPITNEALAFVSAENSEKMDKRYFTNLVNGVTEHQESLDKALLKCVDRSIASIDPVESSILRLAVYELMHRPEIPFRVIVNEAVELAKSLGGEQGHAYVNGVLDKVGTQLRSAEYQKIRDRKP